MAADCGHELKRHNVTFISLWPGAVQTEIVQELMIKPLQESKGQSKPKSQKAQMVDRWFINGETTEFPGKCIVALAQGTVCTGYCERFVLFCEDRELLRGCNTSTNDFRICPAALQSFLGGKLSPPIRGSTSWKCLFFVQNGTCCGSLCLVGNLFGLKTKRPVLKLVGPCVSKR